MLRAFVLAGGLLLLANCSSDVPEPKSRVDRGAKLKEVQYRDLFRKNFN